MFVLDVLRIQGDWLDHFEDLMLLHYGDWVGSCQIDRPDTVGRYESLIWSLDTTPKRVSYLKCYKSSLNKPMHSSRLGMYSNLQPKKKKPIHTP